MKYFAICVLAICCLCTGFFAHKLFDGNDQTGNFPDRDSLDSLIRMHQENFQKLQVQKDSLLTVASNLDSLIKEQKDSKIEIHEKYIKVRADVVRLPVDDKIKLLSKFLSGKGRNQ
jgi:hypothetical protein